MPRKSWSANKTGCSWVGRRTGSRIRVMRKAKTEVGWQSTEYNVNRVQATPRGCEAHVAWGEEKTRLAWKRMNETVGVRELAWDEEKNGLLNSRNAKSCRSVKLKRKTSLKRKTPSSRSRTWTERKRLLWQRGRKRNSPCSSVKQVKKNVATEHDER